MTEQAPAPEGTPEPPPDTGTLTPDQAQRAKDWLDQHWDKKGCPFHGPTNWQIQPQFTYTAIYTPGRLILGGPIIPFLVVVCSICGYTAFVSAIRAGLFPANGPSPAEGPKSEKPEEAG